MTSAANLSQVLCAGQRQEEVAPARRAATAPARGRRQMRDVDTAADCALQTRTVWRPFATTSTNSAAARVSDDVVDRLVGPGSNDDRRVQSRPARKSSNWARAAPLASALSATVPPNGSVLPEAIVALVAVVL